MQTVPGTVISHIPASTGIYVGSPGLAVLPDGTYIASHDEFGPRSTEHTKAVSHIFRSKDKGLSWEKIATIHGAFWSNLFVHRKQLYLLGTDRHHGNAVLHQSTDGGVTWKTVVLRDDSEYHCAPVPIVEHKGRLWRGFEWRNPPQAWGVNYRAGVLSISTRADLMNLKNWQATNFLPSDRSWNGGDMGAWLEGNVVIAPDGSLVDILRVQTQSPDEKAAWASISADGKTMSFDPTTGFFPFPGGAKKFAIRWDKKSKRYWSLASILTEKYRAPDPGKIRNTLALTSSTNLRDWEVRSIILSHPDVKNHGFQYVEWLFEGDDIIAACRTAYGDDHGGAHNNHDANYLTFHRIEDFRNK
ncbi:MAG: sialidase family protein [Armatimonas sp.]